MYHIVNQAKCEGHCDNVERLMSRSLCYVLNNYT